MNTRILILCFLLSSLTIQAQQDDLITYAEFESIKFKSHSMKQLMDVTDYETFLEQHYGIANNKRGSNNPDMPYGSDLFYDSFTLGFDYDVVLIDISITGGTNSFLYKNKELKPGMSIFELKSIFPN